MNLPVLRGKGGKGGGGEVRLPHEDANTLQSRAYARFVDLIADGPFDGFCTEDGITCKDAKLTFDGYVHSNPALNKSPIILSNGSLSFPGVDFPVEADGVICRKLVGGTSTPIVKESAGYPFYTTSTPMKAIIEGDGAGAEIHVFAYPTTSAQQNTTSAIINQTAHGFIVGHVVQKLGSVWYRVTSDVGLGEVRIVTAVSDANNFTAVLDLFPEGRVRGIKLVNAGTNYTWCRITMPSSVLQGILFDDQPLADPVTLSPNFTDIRIEYRLGEEDQTVMKGFEQVEEIFDTSPSPDEIRSGEANAVTRAIEGKFYDRAIVDIQLPSGFFLQNIENGDVESVGYPNAATRNSWDDLISGQFSDYSVLIRIEQRYRKSDDPTADFSAWYPFGQGEYRIAGKTMSSYVRSYEAPLLKPEPHQKYDWELRVTRVTLDDDATARATMRDKIRPNTKIRWSQITGISNLKLSYPFSVLVGVEINAEQFSRIPVRSYRMKMLKCQVPTNYFPPFTVRKRIRADGTVDRSIRTYAEYNRDPETGNAIFDSLNNPVDQTWDGTFYESWTNNPAWIAYMLSTNSRVGVGRYLSTSNKWTYYRIGRYCDETVSTGYNPDTGAYDGIEPRFTAGIYVQARQEAAKFLADVGSIFGGYFYFASGTLVPVQERPRLQHARFPMAPANVEAGMFTYQGSQKRMRHTMAYIKFNDPTSNFKLTPVGIPDDEGILRYGVQEIEKVAFGCISRGQARRFGKRVIRMEQSNTDIVTTVTGLQGSVLRPGDIIPIFDPTRSSKPWQGRVLSINYDPSLRPVLFLDRWFDLEDGLTAADYSVVLSRPSKEALESEITSSEELDKILSAQLVTMRIFAFGQHTTGQRTITLESSLPEGVKVGCVWGLRSTNVNPQYFSVMGVEEVGKHKFSITALEYHEEIFAEIDADVPYSEESINPDLSAWKYPKTVENLQLSRSQKKEQEINVYTLNVSWSKPKTGFGLEYEVWLQKGLGNYQFQTATKSTSVDFRLTEPDNYCVRVVTVGLQGRRSSPAEACTVIGSLSGDNAEIISGLEIKGKGNATTFDTPDLELEWRVNWSGATSELHTTQPPVLPPGVTEYDVKFYDLNNKRVGEFVTTETFFNLSADRNRSLTDGPHRELIVQIRARTDDGGYSAYTAIRVSNAKIAAPEWPYSGSVSYVLEADTEGNVIIRIKDPETRPKDWSGIYVWVSTTPGFTPTAQTAKAFGNTEVITPLTMGVTNYVRWAHFDALTKDALDCNISNEFSVIPVKEARLSALEVMNLNIR